MVEQMTKERHKNDFTNIVNIKKLKSNLIISNNYIIKKRIPLQLRKETNNVYVNSKTNFKIYLKLCEKHLDSDKKEVIIHGLGAAINRVCKLALCLQEIYHGTLELDIKTSSTHITDDLQPKNNDVDFEVNERINSAIHIRVFHIALIGSLKF